MEYVWLLLGFVLLIKGADFFVEGSSSVAKLLKIPTIVIGLTVVAFGTSMPELSVSLTASVNNANDLAVGNVLGSNIFNLVVVLGACALVQPIVAPVSVMKKEFPFSIMATGVLLVALAVSNISGVLAGEGEFTLGRIGAIVLLVLFIWFMVSTVRGALKSRSDFQEDEDYKILSPIRSGIYIVMGCTGIVIGGDLVVESASQIGRNFGMTESFIGLTIVALGTSLPELVTSFVAAKKGENDLAIGNVVGSNLFNLLFILGTSAVISPITVSISSIYDTIILIVINLVVFITAKSKNKITKVEGGVYLLIYVAFFVYILMR